MDSDALINKGCIVIPGGPDPGACNEGRTFIISGLARGGTTMVASVLRSIGLLHEQYIAPSSADDLQMLAVLQSGDKKLLEEVIAQRNAVRRDWAFKLPMIHAYLELPDLSRFRNPHLILVFRDPIAVAVRASISEHFDDVQGATENIVATDALFQFVRRARCPVLLQSYEKALIFPGFFIDALGRFCRLDMDDDRRERLSRTVQPNEDKYLRDARRSFAGAIDLLENGVLYGWCCQVGELEPVTLDLILDGRRATTVKANLFRPDLLEAGYGNGSHGFSIDLVPFDVGTKIELRIRVSGRTFELENSGHSVAHYERRAATNDADALIGEARTEPEPAPPAREEIAAPP